MTDKWTEFAPGCWRRDEPIDEAAAMALMEERLAARGYYLRRRRPSLWARLSRRVAQ